MTHEEVKALVEEMGSFSSEQKNTFCSFMVLIIRSLLDISEGDGKRAVSALVVIFSILLPILLLTGSNNLLILALICHNL